MRRYFIYFLIVLFPWNGRAPAFSRTNSTAPPGSVESSLPLKSNSVRFAVIGDNGTGGREEYEVAQRMTEYHERVLFDFVLMLGDNLYGGSKPSDFEDKFERPYRSLLNLDVKFYAVLGNHDNPNERFYKLFNMGGAKYYTFTKGNCRFFALDSNYFDPPQYAWLEKELENASSQWKICYFHHPLYSSGAAHGPSLALRQILEPLFLKYGVNVVLSGHDHIYERTNPQKGIYYFVSGAGGQLRRGNVRKTDLTAASFDQDRSFMLVEVAEDTMYFQTISRTGKTVDSGALQRIAKSEKISALFQFKEVGLQSDQP
jgi:3',5'-cyclic AMP phosphodiesterase CpdA